MLFIFKFLLALLIIIVLIVVIVFLVGFSVDKHVHGSIVINDVSFEDVMKKPKYMYLCNANITGLSITTLYLSHWLIVCQTEDNNFIMMETVFTAIYLEYAIPLGNSFHDDYFNKTYTIVNKYVANDDCPSIYDIACYELSNMTCHGYGNYNLFYQNCQHNSIKTLRKYANANDKYTDTIYKGPQLAKKIIKDGLRDGFVNKIEYKEEEI